MSFQPGTLVSPNLRLVRKLGQGGMGSVWIAEHLTLRTQVAVKLISPEFASHPGALERFSREAATAAQMKHPHAVQILDHGMSPQGAPFIAMELLEGEDLGHRLKRVGRLSLAETSHILHQTCKALSKAHALGLVHRDIKPENMFLIDVDGELFVKVLDFGIARQIGGGQSATATGAMLGTPYYMSPEQTMSAKHVDAKADLWSLAVVAYQCVTGRVPFDGETIPAVFVSIASGTFVKASHVVSGLPVALDDWFSRALERDPSSRPRSAKDLAESFAAILREPARVEPSHALQPAPAAGLPPVETSPTREELPPTGEPTTLMAAALSQSRQGSRRRVLLATGILTIFAVAAIGVVALVPARNRAPTVVSEPPSLSVGVATGTYSAESEAVPGASAQPSGSQPGAALSAIPDAGTRSPLAPTTRDSKREPRKDKDVPGATGTTTAPVSPPAPAKPKSTLPEVGL